MKKLLYISLLFAIHSVKIESMQKEKEDNEKKETHLPFEQLHFQRYGLFTQISGYAICSDSNCGHYSITRLINGEVEPLSEPKVRLNYTNDQPNPFYNQGLDYLAFINSSPLVAQKNGNAIYYVQRFKDHEGPMQLLSTTCFDAAGNPGHIIGLTSCRTGLDKDALYYYIFTAVQPEDNLWGAEHSGISLIKLEEKTIEIEVPKNTNNKQKTGEMEKQKRIRFSFNNLDAMNGTSGTKAFPITNVIDINGGLDTVCNDDVDLYWDSNFERLFVPVGTVKTRCCATSQQGAHGLLVGSIVDNNLILYPLVEDNVISALYNNIVSAKGASKELGIHKVRTMHASTGIPYLIVVGGEGSEYETKRMVHALPMVNKSKAHKTLKQLKEDREHGGIADRTIVPEPSFYSGRFSRFKGRNITQCATTPKTFYQAEEKAVAVGAGGLLPDPIVQLIPTEECVFVVTGDDQQKTGLYYSQALFDEQGCIIAWTPWQLMYGINTHTIGATLEADSGRFLFLQKHPTSISIDMQQWYTAITLQEKESSIPCLYSMLNQAFAETPGSISCLHTIARSTPGMANKSDMLVAAGIGTVGIVQTSYLDDNNKLTLLNSHVDPDNVRDELFDSNSPFHLYEDPALKTIGPITAAHVIHDNHNNSWLIVGGINGFALLANADGSGWKTNEGVGLNCCNLAGMQFIVSHSIKHIKKIINNGTNCLILTNNALKRLSLSPQALIDNDLVHSTIVDHSQFNNAQFTDCLVSGPLAFIATSQGLFRNSNYSDIRTETVTWQHVKLPTTNTYITKLQCITGEHDQSVFYRGGQLYVLCGSINEHNSELFRLCIHDISAQPITDDTVCIIPDYAFYNVLTYFLSFGGYRSSFATDGFIYLTTRGGTIPFVHTMPSIIGGKLAPSSKGYVIPLPQKGANTIRSIVRSSATGEWIIAGDFGVCVYH